MVTNDHRWSLRQVLVPPKKISAIWRSVKNGKIVDKVIDVWLVGQEPITDGYRIVMREDGKQFGLASTGFPSDKHLVLTGWYGGLVSTFLNM